MKLGLHYSNTWTCFYSSYHWLTTYVCQMLQYKLLHRQLTWSEMFLHLRLIQISKQKDNQKMNVSIQNLNIILTKRIIKFIAPFHYSYTKWSCKTKGKIWQKWISARRENHNTLYTVSELEKNVQFFKLQNMYISILAIASNSQQ